MRDFWHIFLDMSNFKIDIPPRFNSASKEQKIAFVQDLWDQIAKEPENVPIPDSHKGILRERLEEFRSNPDAGRPWHDVREQLLEELFRSEP